MKKLVLSLICLLVLFSLQAQTARTVKTHNIKLSAMKLGYAYEHPLGDKVVLNSELFIGGFFGYDMFQGDYWRVVPSFRLEPRYYYNFEKREEKGKKVFRNVANYISLSMDYVPSMGVGSDIQYDSFLMIGPKWGIRRMMGKHFLFEFALGVGMYSNKPNELNSGMTMDLIFGYTF